MLLFIRKYGAFVLIMTGFFICCADSLAQGTEDVVYLKNGGIIRGKLLEMQDGKLKIETVGRNVFVFSMEEVERMSKEEGLEEDSKKSREPQEKGLVTHISPGLIIGRNNTITPYYYNVRRANVVSGSMQFINGYQFKSRYFIGAGLGIEGFGGTVMPFFADIRYSFFKRGSSPYVYGQGGYSLILDYREGNGGILMAAGLGVKKYFGRSTGMTFSAGYRYQRITYTVSNNPYYWEMQNMTTVIKDIYHRIGISMSFFF